MNAHVYGLNDMNRCEKLQAITYLIDKIEKGADSVILSGEPKRA